MFSIIMHLTMPAVFAATDGRTLDECFQAALRRSEIIGTQTELIAQAEERYRQAKGAIFPTINGVASYLVQAAPAATAATQAPGEQTTAKLTATQPIFHGMKEYAGILQQNLLVTSAMSNKVQAAASLYSDVATNFYSILQLEQDIRDVTNEINIDSKRISDLNARVRIGRSRPSEVLTVKSAVDTLVATNDATRGQLLALREAFAFLTGFDRNMPILETETLTLPSPGAVEPYLQSIEERPDVKAARDSLYAVEKNVTIARAGHFPQIDVTGDYWFKRPGISQDQHWDAQIIGTIPIFAGGIVNSQVREAASQERASELNLARLRRLADQEIRSDYDNFTADLNQVTSLTRATQSALENYQAQTSDYKLGLVTNLDVLTAITSSQESQRALDKSRYLTKLDYIKLQIATARRPKQEELKP
ncbi:MAG: TolC family protein [Deltaproteobacteria bacterium]|nr:TolC family protein [Deltaproteobacteria bacterium]